MATGTISPGSARPVKLTTLPWPERPRRRAASVREAPSTSTSSGRATKRRGAPGALGGAALDDVDQALHARHGDVVGDERLGESGRLGLSPGRVDEGERPV